jgi:hypothetical protein
MFYEYGGNMFTALNEQLIRVHIDDAVLEAHYKCPLCLSLLYMRGGKKVRRHFAHKESCSDGWKYDESEWHKEIQSMWPIENQEVLVNFNNEIHRADVLINDIVILIQDSNITPSEFEERTSFFSNAGYRVVWIFNFTNAYISGNLQGTKFSKYYNKPYEYNWSDPIQTFKNAPDVFENNKFSIWAWIDPYSLQLERIGYISKNKKQLFSLKEFHVDGKSINLDYKIDAECFFGKNQRISADLYRTSPIHCMPYKKYVGEPKHKREEYQCPRNRQDWIQIYGQSGCQYCKACEGIQKRKNNNRIVYEVDCNYLSLLPHEKHNSRPIKETNGAPIIDLTKNN